MIRIDPEVIHARSVEVLSTAGVYVPEERTLDRLSRLGVPVDRDAQIVRLPAEIIQQALKSLPKEVNLCSRDGKRRLPLGEEPIFVPSGAGSMVYDFETGERRPSTARDAEMFVRIGEALPGIGMGGSSVTATDELDDPARHIKSFARTWGLTTKHSGVYADDPEEVEDQLEIVIAQAGGEENLRKNPPVHSIICPLSPLGFSFDIDCMLRFAEYGIPVLALTMTMGGASSPATLTGQLIVLNCEILATAVIVQLLHPGVPVIYGSVSSVLDMRTGVLALGAPERPLLGLGAAEMARFYGMPSYIGGLNADGKQFDEQVGFEKAVTALPLLGKADIIMGMAGMASAITYSVEQLVMDYEFSMLLMRMWKGFDVGDGIEETALIKEVGPRGDFLSHEHTLANYKSYWSPQLFSRESHDTWEVAGQPLTDKVKDRVRQLLAQPPAPPLSDAAQEAIERALKRRGAR